MTDIKLMIIISLACLAFAEWSGVVMWVKYIIYLITGRSYEKRLKPFDCAFCMSFWVTTGIFCYLHCGLWAILYGFATAGVTYLILKTSESITKR